MKGWVYILSNKAMPNLVKVGFSTKDPELRANELHTTGVPYRFVVEYDALVNEPRNVEQKAHVLLKAYHENKEWFRCDIATAIIAIRQAANGNVIHESNNDDLTHETEEVAQYRKAAKQGDANAQCNLGYAYNTGKGITMDYQKAVEWYRKSAEQGNVTAQYNLGVMYKTGKGVTQDSQKAVEWYRKSAEQGNVTAQYYLGVMYKTGVGVTQDNQKAVEWYRKAAEQGNAYAQNYLGLMYQNGEGATTDYQKAVEWYRKSAEQGNADAQNNLENAEQREIYWERIFAWFFWIGFVAFMIWNTH